MKLHRRDVLKGAAALAGAAALPTTGNAQRAFAPTPGAWRSFEIVTRLEIAATNGATQAWVPLPAFDAPEWFKPGGSTWTTNAASAEIRTDAKYGSQHLHLTWTGTDKPATVSVTSKFATRDRAFDLSKPGTAGQLSDRERKLYTDPTTLIPTDGIVKETADKIVAGARTDLEKARLIYEWVVENTFRDPKARGCGWGDIKAMLETGNMGGKCGDINALFVGLARSVGIPARDVYGIRVARSAFGYRELGAGGPDVSRAQHCRAEVWLAGRGWVAMDPADVGKVMRLETPEWLKDPNAPVAAPVYRALFGGWEGNWMAYNVAHDVALPGSRGAKVGFLMYPQAETRGERIDSLDPETFKYKITAREITA